MIMRKYVLSSSILAADFSKLGQEVLETVQAGAEYIHVDIMDGHFVPSLSLGFPVMKSIRPVTDKVFDVHLMISNPQDYIEQFAKDGADIITIHLETTKQPEVLLSRIKELGCKAGLAINPETPVDAIKPYLSIPDMVLVMTVHPGFGGQKYIDECTEKVVEVRKLLDEVNP
ncbi:MAG: ribulose-phosphate 3-epimerase, partial [Lachnospiraceae bacterium]|nr:ribulose-phosphate 3-epimerase [Candidatus Merdinaster equi]